MKKILLFIALTAGLFSCSKILNTTNLQTINTDQVWNSTATAQDFIYSAYSSVLGHGWNGSYTSSVDAYTPNNLPYDQIYNQNNTEPIFSGTLNNNDDPDAGYNNFSEIRQCNMIIDNVTASSGISASDKVGLIAQGYFLRALCNYYTARAFGKIIWIDTVLDENDELRLPTVASPAQSWQYVIQDLETAISLLPATSSPGLANKYIAEALLSEACLEAIAYSSYPSAPSIASQDSLVQLSISSAKAVISSGQYSMDPNYAEMFNGTNPNSSEIIFSQYLSSISTTLQNTPMQYDVINVQNSYISNYGGSPALNNDGLFQAWIDDGPTQNLADAYLVKDQSSSQWLQWNETSQFKAAVNQSARPSTTDIPHNAGETDVEYGIINPASGQTMWSLVNTGRDARWAASIISDSNQFQGETLTTCIDGNATRWMKILNYDYYVSLSNLYWLKNVWTVTPTYLYNTPTNFAYVITRLGRVYLNLAEAYLLEGDITDAVAALNQTRTTHGQMSPSTAADLTTAWTDYKREREVDLTRENDYYWSLLRWGLYGGAANHGNAPLGDIPELDAAPQVTDISKDRMKYVTVQGSFYSLDNVRHFDYPRRYLFPISYQNYILENGNIVQNANW